MGLMSCESPHDGPTARCARAVLAGVALGAAAALCGCLWYRHRCRRRQRQGILLATPAGDLLLTSNALTDLVREGLRDSPVRFRRLLVGADDGSYELRVEVALPPGAGLEGGGLGLQESILAQLRRATGLAEGLNVAVAIVACS